MAAELESLNNTRRWMRLNKRICSYSKPGMLLCNVYRQHLSVRGWACTFFTFPLYYLAITPLCVLYSRTPSPTGTKPATRFTLLY